MSLVTQGNSRLLGDLTGVPAFVQQALLVRVLLSGVVTLTVCSGLLYVHCIPLLRF